MNNLDFYSRLAGLFSVLPPEGGILFVFFADIDSPVVDVEALVSENKVYPLFICRLTDIRRRVKGEGAFVESQFFRHAPVNYYSLKSYEVITGGTDIRNLEEYEDFLTTWIGDTFTRVLTDEEIRLNSNRKITFYEDGNIEVTR